ncbi:hypothetical protein ABFS83_08G075300 [Erythranthe nasuta]
MASSPETSPGGENGDSPPPPPPPDSESPPDSPPASPPPESSPPSPPAESSPPPPAAESPPTKNDPPSPPPPDTTTPEQSPPPPDNPVTPSPPSNSRPPPSSTPNLGPPEAPVFTPPSTGGGGGGGSQSPPSPAIPRLPPRSPSTDSSAGPSNSSSSGSNAYSDIAIIAGILGAGVFFVALVFISLMCTRKRKKQEYYGEKGVRPPGDEKYHKGPNPNGKLPPPPGGTIGIPAHNGWGGGATPSPQHMAPIATTEFVSGQHPPQGGNVGGYGSKSPFTYDELAAATAGFSQANLLGQGGFGLVHKGILPNGREVAVKSLKSGSGQGQREFQAEVEIISRVHHRHLVSLVGYCIAGEQKMLVYEFVANKTLEFHLHGKGQPVMDWASRLRIAVGSAKGLAYLHEDCHPRIIHRDIKAANILLDMNFEAMVADFGLAKLTSDNYTHVSTRVMGTFGYLAPEYAASGKLTEKSDVFSFGVMLLELITGRRPVDLTNKTMEDSLVDWARPLLTEALENGNYAELVDPRLEGNYVPHEIARMIACAAASIRHSARRRPRMSQIVRALDGDSSLEDLNEGVKPGQSQAYNPANTNRDIYDTGAYNADLMKFRQMVMSTQEVNSTDYGATTSEYGINPSVSSGDSSEDTRNSPHNQKR